jgi:hypothetical protein
MPRKPTKKTGGSSPMTKSAFVRSLPSLPAKEVVEQAKAAGITLKPKQVYNIRAAAKGKSAKKTTAKNGASHAVSGLSSRKSPARIAELLLAVAAEMGLARAIELLEGERRKVQSILG